MSLGSHLTVIFQVGSRGITTKSTSVNQQLLNGQIVARLESGGAGWVAAESLTTV